MPIEFTARGGVQLRETTVVWSLNARLRTLACVQSESLVHRAQSRWRMESHPNTEAILCSVNSLDCAFNPEPRPCRQS